MKVCNNECQMIVKSFCIKPRKVVGKYLYASISAIVCYEGIEYRIHCNTAIFKSLNRKITPSHKTLRRLTYKIRLNTSSTIRIARKISKRIANFINTLEVIQKVFKDKKTSSITVLADTCPLYIVTTK